MIFTMKFSLFLLSTLSAIYQVKGLDLQVTGFTCENLPVIATSLTMTCGDNQSPSHICTFGEEVLLTGTCKYQHGLFGSTCSIL